MPTAYETNYDSFDNFSEFEDVFVNLHSHPIHCSINQIHSKATLQKVVLYHIYIFIRIKRTYPVFVDVITKLLNILEIVYAVVQWFSGLYFHFYNVYITIEPTAKDSGPVS